MLNVWFMWIQVLSCGTGSVMLISKGQYAMAWVWGCYALANLGFVWMASH